MTALANIKLDYNWERQVKDHEEMKKQFPSFYDKEGKPKHNWDFGDHHIVDSEEMTRLSKMGVEFTVKRFAGVIPVNLAEKIPDNSTVHIHVPNYALNSYNEVTVLYDCCTETLQGKLDDGWRIIAVCPPINQRRPDYIIGRCVV